ncbi:MAG TPA: hypothetical protein VFB16_14625 [Bauldia sp.]|nr:hypothetical protein [Bauldia sp.]
MSASMVAHSEPNANLPLRPAIASRAFSPGALLALDLGSSTGWALKPKAGPIVSGTLTLKPGRFEGGGMVFLRFGRWLSEVRASASIEGIWFEEVRAHAGTLAAQVYGGFLAALTSWSEERGIPYEGVPVGTIKRFATGKGNASKDEVIAAVRRLGFSPADHNEADALALLTWVIAKRGQA